MSSNDKPMLTRAMFDETMAAMAIMFPEREITPEVVELYYRLLAFKTGMTDEELRHARNEILLRNRFFPKPVDFLEHAEELRGRAAYLEWEEKEALLKAEREAAKDAPPPRQITSAEAFARAFPEDAKRIQKKLAKRHAEETHHDS